MKTMKNLTLKLAALLLVFFFAAHGAFAQNPPAPFAQYDANKTAPTNIEYVTLKTGGTTMRYYALPDPIYHPNYVAAGTLEAGFVWNWDNPTDPGTPATIGAGPSANSRDITFLVTGDYVINVQEEAPVAFGGCASAITTIMNVTVVAPPSAQFTTADVTTGLCGDQAAEAIEIALTEAGIPNALKAYAFRVSEVVDRIDAGGGLIANVSTNNTFVDFGLGAKAKTGTGGFTAADPSTYGFNSSALNVESGNRTRYTYTLTSTAGVTGTGVVSAISQKSDFLVDPVVNAHPFGAKTTVIFIVNPAPVTGPIYHVPNTYAY
jgi:hypothetical protein